MACRGRRRMVLSQLHRALDGAHCALRPIFQSARCGEPPLDAPWNKAHGVSAAMVGILTWRA